MARPARKALFALVPLLGLLLCAELVARVSEWRKARREVPWDLACLETTQGVVLGAKPGGLVWELDPYLLWRNRPGQRHARGTINAQGFRGPDWSLARRPGLRRVVVLGGSVAYGWGVEGDERTIAARVEQRLRASGVEAEVWNAGVIAYASTQELILLATVVLEYAPDAVVVLDGWNDLYYASRAPADQPIRPLTFAELEQVLARGAQGGWNLLRLSALWRRLEGRGGAGPAGPLFQDHPRGVPDYRRNLEHMVRLARAAGVAALIVPQPELSLGPRPPEPEQRAWVEGQTGQGWLDHAHAHYPRYVEAARAVAAAEGAAFLDGTRALDALPGPAFTDACHLGPEANQALAEEIAAELARLLAR
mgnify:CR=1 FL=1